MPKSKRNKIVHLTQVKKKGKDHKEDLAKQLETYLAQFTRVFIFDIDKTKSDRLTLLRVRLKSNGRIFAGRNSVVISTLKSYGDKCHMNYADLVDQITGHRGLFFTNIKKDELMTILSKELPEFCPKLLGYVDIEAKSGLKNKGNKNESSPSKKSNQSKDQVSAGDSEKSPSKKENQKTKVKFVKI